MGVAVAVVHGPTDHLGIPVRRASEIGDERGDTDTTIQRTVMPSESIYCWCIRYAIDQEKALTSGPFSTPTGIGPNHPTHEMIFQPAPSPRSDVGTSKSVII